MVYPPDYQSSVGGTGRTSSGLAAPAAVLLDAWSSYAWSGGLQIEQLHELDVLTVRTQNSNYEIVVQDPRSREILVRGGKFFPEFTRVRLAGSSLGGSFLKLGGVYAGFRLELQLGIRTVITSPVQLILVRVSAPSNQ